jgi:hypothetical protein
MKNRIDWKTVSIFGFTGYQEAGMQCTFKIQILLLIFQYLISSAVNTAATVEDSLNNKDFLKQYISSQVSTLQKQLSLSTEQTKKVRQILSQEDWPAFFKIAGRLETFDSSMRDIYAAGKTPLEADVQKAVTTLHPMCREGLAMMMRRSKQIQEILTPRQLALYEPDMRELEANSAELTERLSRWEKGRFHPGELESCFGHKIDSPDASSDELSPKSYSMTSTDFWDLYVQIFIEAFQLDRGQQTLAYSLLSEMKIKARAYFSDHTAEFTSLESAFASLKENKNTQSSLHIELLKKKEKLELPILEMFQQLRERLMKIPTREQTESAAKVLESQVEKLSPNTSTKPMP